MTRIGSLAAVVLLLLSSADHALAQGPGGNRTAAGCSLATAAQFHECALPKMKTFDPPRTPDGKPDFAGYWNRVFASQDLEDHGGDGLNTQAAPSLVIDTPDHKIPYQPWALEFRKGIAQRIISPMAACLPPGIPRHAIAPAAHQIVQTPGAIMYLLEYSHSFRVIPISDAPHPSSDVHLFEGSSRGHWDGNTLVVDVTNLNGLTWLDNAGNFVSDALHVTERLTMVDRDTIHYEARLEDPKVFTRPWTIVAALTRINDKGYEIWEQACVEGNQSVTDLVGLGYQPWLGIPKR